MGCLSRRAASRPPVTYFSSRPRNTSPDAWSSSVRKLRKKPLLILRLVSYSYGGPRNTSPDAWSSPVRKLKIKTFINTSTRLLLLQWAPQHLTGCLIQFRQKAKKIFFLLIPNAWSSSDRKLSKKKNFIDTFIPPQPLQMLNPAMSRS
jgi:hypothetical protein